LTAASGNRRTGPKAVALRDNLPESISCDGQPRLEFTRTRAALREERRTDVPDLAFSDPEGQVRLLIELKIDADFGDRQIERYLEARWYVAAIVLAPEDVEKPGVEPELLAGWLGAISWQAILPALRSMDIEPDLRAQWRELLNVMESDRDFEPTPDNALELELEGKWLAEHQNEIVDAFRTAIGKAAVMNPELETLRNPTRVRVTAPWQGFAWLELRLSGSDVCVGMRPGYAFAPTVAVGWYLRNEPRSRKARKQLRNAMDPC
jgi:hypothetical protein